MDNIEVTSRSNNGDDSRHPAKDFADAERIAKSVRVSSNHMVCVLVNGQRQKRWDRHRIVGENRWREVSTTEFMVIGPIREIRRG